MTKTAVVLMNLGGPRDLGEVKPFLLSLFSDPAIIGLPGPLRWVIAKLVTSRRTPEAKKIYSLLGGGSPLLENTEAQARALEKELGEGYRVFIAMRHAQPRTEEAVRRVEDYHPDEVILLPLYPQLSTTTTTSSFKEWRRLFKGGGPVREVCCYPTGDGFIQANSQLLREAYERALSFGQPKVLLTAHGLPEKTIQRGDPYCWQVEQTAQAIVGTCGIEGMDTLVCYQSRVGPMKWVEPYTDKEIEKAAHEGRPLVVVPISFVSEHSETLVELDMEYKELAEEKGCPAYIRVSTVGVHPLFIKELANMVKKPSAPLGCPAECGECYCREVAVA